MAISFLTQRRRHLRAMGQRFQDEHRALANVIGRLFLQAATGRSEGGERIIPNRRTTRDALVATIYAQVLKPYYVGSSEEPFTGARPLSPYAWLLYDGVAGMVRIEAEAQAALVRRLVSDEVVVEWLLSPYTPRRPVTEMSFSSFTQWVDPRGFRLTERIQRVAVEVRSRVARFVDYHIGQGTLAPTMVTKVEAFLTTGERGKTTYGQQGAVAPRVLVHHEMIKAGGDAVIAESEINPYVRGAQWLLDPTHPKVDHCDVNAAGGENGDGVYPLSELPAFPDHINCMCHLRAVPVRNPVAVTAALRQAIEEREPAAEALRGALNPERVTTEVLTGAIQQTANGVQASPLSLPGSPETPKEVPAPLATSVTITGDIDALGRAGFTQEKVNRLFDIGADVKASVQITSAETEDGREINIVGKWTDAKTGELVGTASRALLPERKRAFLAELSFEQKYIGNGRGITVARNWFDALHEAGYEKAELYAGMTIGRYAWAKEGAVYADPRQAQYATALFREWVVNHGITDLASDEYPVFKSVLDVATYRHPRGLTLLGKDIVNSDVPADMVLPLGKAFMLDTFPQSHGGWEGVIDLTERARRLAAITEMSDAAITEVKRSSRFVHIDSQSNGLSDALFWEKYLVDDDSTVRPLVL